MYYTWHQDVKCPIFPFTLVVFAIESLKVNPVDYGKKCQIILVFSNVLGSAPVLYNYEMFQPGVSGF